MKEDLISSSTTTCSMRSSGVATLLPLSFSFDPRSLRVDERVLRVLLDELPPGLDVLAHQDGEHPVRLGGVLQRDLLQHTGLGIHGRLPELFGLHLGQALESLDVQLLLTIPLAKVLERGVV